MLCCLFDMNEIRKKELNSNKKKHYVLEKCIARHILTNDKKKKKRVYRLFL